MCIPIDHWLLTTVLILSYELLIDRFSLVSIDGLSLQIVSFLDRVL